MTVAVHRNKTERCENAVHCATIRRLSCDRHAVIPMGGVMHVHVLTRNIIPIEHMIQLCVWSQPQATSQPIRVTKLR